MDLCMSHVAVYYQSKYNVTTYFVSFMIYVYLLPQLQDTHRLCQLITTRIFCAHSTGDIMAPVDDYFIISAFEAIKSGGRTFSAITSIITNAASLVDGGMTVSLERMISWGVDKICNDFRDDVVLSILIIIEYYKRTCRESRAFMGVDWARFRGAWNLSNRCSRCRLKGHNIRNCPDRLVQYLKARDLLGSVEDGLNYFSNS
jgi:hypothetical protein